MSLFFFFRSRRAKRNTGHAEIAVMEASGHGRVVVAARIAAAFLPQPRVIRGSGAAAIAVTEGYGSGYLVVVDDELLLRLLISAA